MKETIRFPRFPLLALGGAILGLSAMLAGCGNSNSKTPAFSSQPRNAQLQALKGDPSQLTPERRKQLAAFTANMEKMRPTTGWAATGSHTAPPPPGADMAPGGKHGPAAHP